MPEGTRVGATTMQRMRSPAKNPVYGLVVGFGRRGTVVGFGWTVGSAIGSSAEREAGSAGAAAGWTSARLRAGLEGEPCSDSVSRPGGRAAELWRVPPSETGAATDGVRAQTTAAEVGSETVGDSETAFLAGSAA